MTDRAEQKAVAPVLRLRSAPGKGWFVDAPEINGLPLETVTSLSLHADACGLPKVRIEFDVLRGLDIELPSNVTVTKRYALWRWRRPNWLWKIL